MKTTTKRINSRWGRSEKPTRMKPSKELIFSFSITCDHILPVGRKIKAQIYYLEVE
jgi:hypothetical protein